MVTCRSFIEFSQNDPNVIASYPIQSTEFSTRPPHDRVTDDDRARDASNDTG